MGCGITDDTVDHFHKADVVGLDGVVHRELQVRSWWLPVVQAQDQAVLAVLSSLLITSLISFFISISAQIKLKFPSAQHRQDGLDRRLSVLPALFADRKLAEETVDAVSSDASVVNSRAVIMESALSIESTEYADDEGEELQTEAASYAAYGFSLTTSWVATVNALMLATLCMHREQTEIFFSTISPDPAAMRQSFLRTRQRRQMRPAHSRHAERLDPTVNTMVLWHTVH